MSATKIEFAVQMTCNSCVEAVRKSLQNVNGIKSFEVNLENETVVIESNLPTLEIQKVLESTGKKVAVKGYGGYVAGVSIIESSKGNIQGVVRFVQASPQNCIVDGTIDGLTPGLHGIHIYECGDLSQGCDSVGDVFNPSDHGGQRIYGNIGNIQPSTDGRTTFRLEDNVIKLSDIIGRSFVITDQTSKESERVACGVIARSAGLFQNPKQICACDGVTLWDEISKPKKSTL